MAIGITGANNGYSRPAADNRFFKLSGGELAGNLTVAGNISASQAIIANTLVAGVDVITVSPIDNQLTLDLTYANKLVRFSFATDGDIIVPLESGVNFLTGSVITLTQIGAGIGTLSGASPIVFNSIDNGYSSAGQYAAMQIIKVGSNTWDVIGGVV
jgi:hypothetical protein